MPEIYSLSRRSSDEAVGKTGDIFTRYDNSLTAQRLRPNIDGHRRLPERQRQEPCNEHEPMKPKTEIRGRKIASCLLGPEDAPVIVLSHALGSSSEIWGYQLPVLSAKFRVLVYDLPGHGESDPPVGQDSFDALATDLPALLDHTGVG